MSRPTVVSIKIDGVSRQEAPHECSQVAARRFEQQMDMVGHQANQKEPHLEKVARFGQLIEKPLPVGVLPENDPSFVPPKSYVINRTGKLQSQRSRHEEHPAGPCEKWQGLIFILRADPDLY
jgi:hypothetical protein